MTDASITNSPKDLEDRSLDCESQKDTSTPPSDEQTGSRFLRKGGTVGSSFCLTNAALGAGVLALAYDASRIGLGFMTLFMFLGAALTVVAVCLLGEACLLSGSFSFDELSHKLFNSYLAGFTGFNMTVNCMGAILVYTIVIRDTFNVLFREATLHNGFRVADLVTILVSLFILVPLGSMREIGFMRKFAFIGIVGWYCLVITVAYILIRYGMAPDVSGINDIWVPRQNNIDFMQYVNAFSTVTFAFCNQFNVPQVVQELSPRTREHVRKIANVSTAIAFVLFWLVMLLGLMAFGFGAGQKPDMVKDLTQFVGQGDVVCFISLLLIIVGVICCYGFHVFPIRQTAAYVVRRIRKREENEQEDSRILWWTTSRFWDLFTGIMVVCLLLILALVYPSFTNAIHFIGAFCSSYLAYILPPVFALRARMLSKENDFRWTQLKNIGCVLLAMLGVFFSVTGTISAFMNQTKH